MTARHRMTVAKRVTTAVVLGAMMLSACGSGVATVDEAAIQASPGEVLPLEPLELTTDGGQQYGSSLNADGSGHQYGSTIEEWTEVERDGQAPSERQEGEPSLASDYALIEWKDLIPPGSSGAEVMARFEEQLESVEFGSEEAEVVYEEIQAAFDPEAVNTSLDRELIRLAGFVAPLTYEGDIVTEFLLVPNFGACVHVPPPPANQTIVVTLSKADGLTIDETYGAVWVQGTLVIDAASTDLAPASYKITNATTGVYDSF